VIVKQKIYKRSSNYYSVPRVRRSQTLVYNFHYCFNSLFVAYRPWGLRSAAAMACLVARVQPRPSLFKRTEWKNTSAQVQALDMIGGVESDCGRDEMLPRINIGADVWGESSTMTGVYQSW